MIEPEQRDHCHGCGIALAPIDPDDPDDFGELCGACLAGHPIRAARRRRTAGDPGRLVGREPTATPKASGARRQAAVKRLADPQLRLFAEAGAAVVNVSTPKASGARRQETVKRLADQRLRLFAEADATVVNVSDMGEIVANGGDSGPLEIRRGTVELVDAFIGAERECFAEWCVLLDRRGRVDGDAVVASQDRGHAAAERLRSCCANQQLRTVIERERLELLRAQVNEEWAVESAIAAQRRKAQRDPIREAWSERRAWLYSARDALSVALGWPHRGERVTVTGSYHAAETGDRAARQHTYAGPAIYLHTYDTHNVSSQVWVPERDHRGQRFELLVCWEPHETWGRADPAGKVAMRRTAAPEQRLPVPLPRWPTTDDAAAYSPARERADAQASRR